MQIYQPLEGYSYNSDTLFLYDFARPFLRPKTRLLDIGAGSGILGLLCARDFEAELVMVEREAPMVRYATENARVNRLSATIIESGFLELDHGALEPFEVAISNPPFYHASVVKSQNPSLYAARYEENLPLKALLAHLKRFLKPRGSFIFCFDAKQSDRVFFELRSHGYNAEVARFVHPRIDREATLVMIHARLDSKSPLRVLPPLFVFEGEDHTSEVRAIFKRARTHSIKCQI